MDTNAALNQHLWNAWLERIGEEWIVPDGIDRNAEVIVIFDDEEYIDSDSGNESDNESVDSGYNNDVAAAVSEGPPQVPQCRRQWIWCWI